LESMNNQRHFLQYSRLVTIHWTDISDELLILQSPTDAQDNRAEMNGETIKYVSISGGFDAIGAESVRIAWPMNLRVRSVVQSIHGLKSENSERIPISYGKDKIFPAQNGTHRFTINYLTYSRTVYWFFNKFCAFLRYISEISLNECDSPSSHWIIAFNGRDR
jgi:hypothetical protein